MARNGLGGTDGLGKISNEKQGTLIAQEGMVLSGGRRGSFL